MEQHPMIANRSLPDSVAKLFQLPDYLLDLLCGYILRTPSYFPNAFLDLLDVCHLVLFIVRVALQCIVR